MSADEIWAVKTRRLRLEGLGFLLLIVTLAMPGAASTARDDWQEIERIIAIGDVHGDYDNFLAVLKDAEVVNRRGKWVAGEAHVVQVGDIPDRGPDTLKIIRFLQNLEKQAVKAGGRLHLLIGNHEHMNITGDLRYVHPGEYKAFKTRNSPRLRDNYYALVSEGLSRQRSELTERGEDTSHLPIVDDAFKKQWYAEHPLGFVEHRLAWQPGGEIFEWVAAHNTVIRINRTLFLHGGLSAELIPMTLSDINDQIRAELRREPYEGAPLGSADFGPLWYRGLARGDEIAEAANLRAVLEHFDADSIVLGHTPDLNVITPRFGGRVVIIDVGISDHYGGHRGSLLIENDSMVARHNQEQQRLPTLGSDTREYFEALAKKLPGNARLDAYIEAQTTAEIDSTKAQENAAQPVISGE